MTEIRSTDYFAIIPEYVLYADITSNAVRLYAILNRFANSNGHAWPSRKKLAELMQCSTATIDRAKDELVQIDALQVETRTSPAGDYTTNLYTLQVRPSSQMIKGSRTREETGSPTNDELKRDIKKQSQKTAPSRVKTCPTCLGSYRAGYDDGTEGLAHIFNRETDSFLVCPTCEGSGAKT
jgi:hypothetical protein